MHVVPGQAPDQVGLPALASRDADPAAAVAVQPVVALSDAEALACSLENPESCEACQ
nr:hypothetical protein [Micromonospora tulbaghiae]